MMFERFGILFWLAVAILASRAILEIGRGLKGVLRRTAPRLATRIRGPKVIFLIPTASEADPVPPQPATPPPARRPVVAPAPNLLETMSHDEMDSLLKPRA